MALTRPQPAAETYLPEWVTTNAPVAYPDALETMDARVAAIAEGKASELVWLLEHPPLYTAGTSSGDNEVLAHARFPTYGSGRGGRVTYHGPGQRIAYVMLNLRARDNDIRAHVWRLEEWVIMALASLGIEGRRADGRIGVWVNTPRGEEKIAALGVRVRRGVAFHGIAVNINPNLDHFRDIVPCGLSEFGVTSLAKLGCGTSMTEFDILLREHWENVFNSPACCSSPLSRGEEITGVI